MTASSPLSILSFPYTRLTGFEGGAAELREAGRQPGSALVWATPKGAHDGVADLVRARPGGLSLLVILPPDDAQRDLVLHERLRRTRPHGLIPFHPSLTALDLVQVLRRPPSEFAGEITDYLKWRGLEIDRETTQVLRRIIDLSLELKSVSAVSRSMYVSRRALGRRLMTRGLPVPSHWLHLGRLLRVAMKLQNTNATVASVAFEHGYPDAFSVSNQMERLLGQRPSTVRKYFGWEWLLESWLRLEAERGGLAPSVAVGVKGDPPREQRDPIVEREKAGARRRPARTSGSSH